MTDEERNDLVISHLPLAKSIAIRYSRTCSFLDFDDFFQEASFALVIAARSYTDIGASFGVFARVVVTNRLNALYSRTKKKLCFSIERSFPEDYFFSSDICFNDVADFVALQENFALLQEDEKSLVKLKMSGLNQAECAVILKMSQAKVSRKLDAIQEKSFV